MRRQAGELDARLASARHTGRSADQLVTAVVTGQGKLVDLRIEDRALYGAHAQKVGLGIVEAVRTARTAAGAASLPQLNALFGKQPLPPAAQGPEQISDDRPMSPEPARRSAEPDEDESFEEFDFLSDDGSESEGARW